MSTRLLLHPIYEEDEFKYVTLGKTLEIVKVNDVHHDLYLFCKSGFESTLRRALYYMFSLCSKTFIVVDGNISVSQASCFNL